ncbi:MAG: FKBP-type peptidyl-prolyl cis-trans isomerase [Candidatus Absconditabacteria bacterium]
MKKYLLLSSAVALLVLSGCASQTPSVDQSEQTAPIENTGAQAELLSGTNPSMCKQAISDHLAAANLEGTGTVLIKDGHKVTVHYVGRLNDQEVFDTSVEAVAKACGKYTPARNYNEGLGFTVGAGQMIAGFDKGVVGMKVGQTKTITIPAKEAYGEWTGAALITVPRSQLPAGEFTKGMKLGSANGQTFTVYEIKKDEVILDGNHELAGKDLIFDITVISID